MLISCMYDILMISSANILQTRGVEVSSVVECGCPHVLVSFDPKTSRPFTAPFSLLITASHRFRYCKCNEKNK